MHPFLKGIKGRDFMTVSQDNFTPFASRPTWRMPGHHPIQARIFLDFEPVVLKISLARLSLSGQGRHLVENAPAARANRRSMSPFENVISGDWRGKRRSDWMVSSRMADRMQNLRGIALASFRSQAFAIAIDTILVLPAAV
jgi:hypothetical protein